ncbi:hypothetical protein GAY29_16320 [Azospirillum brasilense]|uniref:hypothetical protein n=1 Tax=Azospirillum brasilense TaxID=192 RepID=UPI00190C1EA9|nr:hypothetical protein [Azospirillum brasilense]MBK3734636.1 hypothetical protein [Azospirillum brasilense]
MNCRFLLGLLAAVLLSAATQGIAEAVVLEESTPSAQERTKAKSLRDQSPAPRSVLGDVGHEMGKGIAEGLDAGAVRGSVITSGLKATYIGKCVRTGTHEVAKYDVGYSNGVRGMVFVRCERGCWAVQTFPGGQTANNCGEFDKSSWHGPSGMLDRSGPDLDAVANFTLR